MEESLGYEIVKDRNGKKHKVYSALYKDRKTIAKFASTYNPEEDTLVFRMLVPKLDEEGIPMRDNSGNYIYDDEPVEELLEIIEMALDHKEPREEILEWLDLDTANRIILSYVKQSNFQKKKKSSQEKK